MKTLLCPNCHGDCCVNKRGSVVDHGSVLALHSCPDCPDGFAPANPLCSTCGGLCCRITASLHTRVSHRSVTHTTHECDCLDGTAPAPDFAAERLTALLDAERENTALRVEVTYLRGERAAVVAFLRACEDESCVFADDIAFQFAAEIERGEHRREGAE
jgi:hypothetical protein